MLWYSLKRCAEKVLNSIIIDGLLKVGKTDLALELLEEACTKGLKPNLITFTSVEGGLSRKGKVHEAIQNFRFLEGLGIRLNNYGTM